MEGLKLLFYAGTGSGSIWLIILLAAGLPALIVAVLLFLLRKRPVAPWIWVPVVGWSAWAGLSLIPTALPHDPRYGPPQWNIFGYDALFVLCVLTFCGAVVIGALVGFPRRSIWSVKSWIGGVGVALTLPWAGWLLFTTPFTLQLVGPDGKPVAGAVVYRLKPGLGSRLPAVSDKISDADGIVVYRSFPHKDIKLLVPGNSSWVTTELSIQTSREGRSKWEFRNFRQLSQSWGMGSALSSIRHCVGNPPLRGDFRTLRSGARWGGWPGVGMLTRPFRSFCTAAPGLFIPECWSYSGRN